MITSQPLYRRVNSVGDVTSSFTSWDRCMSKPYCKWPAITGIVIGSLVALLLLWCCFKCCGGVLSCCGCCGSKGKKNRNNHAANPMAPGPYGGYQAAPQHPVYEPPQQYPPKPQFAQFDVARKSPDGARVNDDALPAMPSWETAQSRKVLEEQKHADDLEMGRLDPATGQKVPEYQQHTGQHSPVVAAYQHSEQRSPLVTGPYGAAAHPAGDLGHARPDHGNDYAELPAANTSPIYGRGPFSDTAYEPTRTQAPTGYDNPAAYNPPAAHTSPTAYTSPAAYGRAPTQAFSSQYPHSPANAHISPAASPPLQAPSPYAAYSPYAQQQQSGANPPPPAPGHDRPPQSAGKPPQDSWTVV